MKHVYAPIAIISTFLVGIILGFNLGNTKDHFRVLELHKVEQQRDMWKEASARSLSAATNMLIVLNQCQDTAKRATDLAEKASKFGMRISQEYNDYREKHPPTMEDIADPCPNCPMWTVIPYYLDPNHMIWKPYAGDTLPRYHTYFLNHDYDSLNYPKIPLDYRLFDIFGLGSGSGTVTVPFIIRHTPTPTPTPEPSPTPLLEIQTTNI